ncbi:MAG: ammonium transporter [Bifidobacteriaceae bacterium]|jgi:Amt family ammonium transporter|nr:ammonium transporter [Bifidobacteriaceae bacterium]
MLTVDSGATAWVLASATLVLLMTIPALALFYGGMVRGKSVLNMMMMSFGAAAVVGVTWVLWGYSEAFGGDIGGVVGNPFEAFGLMNIGIDDIGGSIPTLVFIGFQATFAVITVALISGAIADRTRFVPWLIFAGIWVTVVYGPLCHMVWGGGLLGADGPIAHALVAPMDFAGGTVVHINAGVAGLVLTLIIGRRIGFAERTMRPHNLPFVMLGAGLLWVGWFGFNSGSALAADGLAGLAWVNTFVAPAAAAGSWMVAEKIRQGKASSLGAASGVVAGLVAVTPAAGFVSPVGAIFIGGIAGVLCAMAVSLKHRWGYDDSLDVVGVHLVGGLVGTVLVGFWSTSTGLFYGGGFDQLIAQILAAGFAMVYCAIATAAIGLAIKATIGWRIKPAYEISGIDMALHGETAYNPSPSHHPAQPSVSLTLPTPSRPKIPTR